MKSVFSLPHVRLSFRRRAFCIAGNQITMDVGYVASPKLTVPEARRLEKLGAAVDEFLDKIG
jgi:hypothetical protein